MIFRTTVKFFSSDASHFEDKSEVTMEFCPNRTKGLFSHNAQISLSDAEDADLEPFISFEINKNQALYLRNILDAFVNEKDIDIDEED